MYKKIISAIATSAFGLVLFTGTVFAVDVTIDGNGAGSTNTIKIKSSQSSSLTQKNKAHFSNIVTAESNTGDNKANKNTGGDVSISTGDATTGVTIDNAANANSASQLPCCCCDSQLPLSVSITGNGADSKNKVKISKTCTTSTWQSNKAWILNDVLVSTDTGDNKANKNTGGTLDLTTGASDTTIDITNAANSNVIGGGI